MRRLPTQDLERFPLGESTKVMEAIVSRSSAAERLTLERLCPPRSERCGRRLGIWQAFPSRWRAVRACDCMTDRADGVYS